MQSWVKRSLMAVAIVVVLALPQVAQAQDWTIDSISARQAEGLFREMGFTNIEIDADDDLIVTMQGMRVLVLVGSVNGELLQMRFSVTGSDATLETVNEWNRTKRYSRAYLDSDGDPVLEAEQDLEGSVTLDRLKDFIRTFNLSLSTFLREVV